MHIDSINSYLHMKLLYYKTDVFILIVFKTLDNQVDKVMLLTPYNGSSTTLNCSTMADYQHGRSMYVAVTIAHIVGHHHSTTSCFENKNQATNDVKDLLRSRRPPITSARGNQAEGNPL